jgi:hypothetical protein
MITMEQEFIPGHVRARMENWWASGDQEFPCLLAETPKADYVASVPDTNDLNRFWTDTDFIMARTMAHIDATTYHGLAVPVHYIDQGSSAMACVLGCPMSFVDKETAWADHFLITVEQVMDLTLDEGNPVYARILELTRRSAALAGGHHLVAPFALEGMTDLLAALYGIENFLVDLIDKPEAVERAMGHLKNLWIEAFARFQGEIARSGNAGGSSWVGIWAPGTTFPIQEDVAYNLSPDMFRRFCIPHIVDEVAVMEYPFFHLDGTGMLPHLDALLEIKELTAIQWQPGAGKESIAQWYDVLRRILAAGKSLQVYARPEEVDDLVRNVGADRLLVKLTNATSEQVARLFERYSQDRI